MTSLPVRRRRTVAAGLLAASALASAATAATPPAADVVSCRYPANAVADRWVALTRPAGAVAPVSVQALDQDPCAVLAADARGNRWRSTDAGGHWTPLAGGPALTRILTERLQPRASGAVIGAVLGTGPSPDDPSGLPQVYASDDGGVTYAPARLSVGVDTTLGTVERTVPLRMAVTGATTAVHYEAGVAKAYVYLAGRATTTALPELPAGANAMTLLRSTDGGHSFRVVQGARQLTPTTIAVNPTSQDEIWVNDAQPGAGGGAWVSYDGGATFQNACCADAAVRDIAIGAAADGSIVVLLATDAGLRRSIDDGVTWVALTDEPATSVRTPADDPATVLAATARGVLMSTGDTGFVPLPGTPGCGPLGLRRDDQVPSTFLADCPGGRATYRLLLTRYAGRAAGRQPVPTAPAITDPTGQVPVGRPLTELARWDLPDSNSATGTIAFDGSVLYYDMNTPGDIGRIRASDGKPLRPWHTDYVIVSLTVDLRRNDLIVTSGTGDFDALDITTGRHHSLGLPPTKVASYDSSHDELSWVPEGYQQLFHRALRGDGPGIGTCRFGYASGINETSTFVASGDGGGYVQLEDDSTILRLDHNCALTGQFTHRRFSESDAENDAMACDTQSYFPQPAIWIRDSRPQTVTAYGVPFGYCPMPSALALHVPRSAYAGSLASLCADLTNATTGSPAADRGVAVTVAGAVVGHGQTDELGRVCVPYLPAGGFTGRRVLDVAARFAGDSALYPSSARSTMDVLDSQPLPPLPPRQAALVPPPPPYAPAVPPNPIPNPGPAPGNAPAPNAAQAPGGQMQAQAQPVAQGVVAPQRQQQPQLALARAANAIGLEENAMVAPARRRRPVPVDPAVAVGLLAVGCVATAGATRVAFARGRSGPCR